MLILYKIWISMKHLPLQVLEQIRNGHRIVWATMLRSTGSTPQKPGSSAIFGMGGLISGTVGGGIMEAETGALASELLNKGGSRLCHFNLNSDQGSEGATCGGEADILLDASPATYESVLESLEKSLENRKGGKLITLVGKEPEKNRKIERYWIEGETMHSLPGPVLDLVEKANLKLTGKIGTTGTWLEEIPLPKGSSLEMACIEYLFPLPRLIIAGAGHLGRALSHLGKLLEFEVTVVDDRPDYANPENLPDADHVLAGDLGRSLEGLMPDADTYCVIVTRGHLQDGRALRPLIGSGAAYVGMIGSRRKVALMKKQFLDEGWATLEQWDAIRAPVGVPIGSKTVQEIAISIAAELIAVRNKYAERDGK